MVIGGGYWGINQLDFTADTFSNDTFPDLINFNYANAAISDKNGDLLFYTNGWSVYDWRHKEVINGDSLNPGYVRNESKFLKQYRVPQSIIIIPDLKDTARYNIFHLRGRSRDGTSQGVYISDLMQTTVDCSNIDSIKVVEKNKSIIEDTLFFGGLTACRHGNGRDWWIVISNTNSSQYYSVHYSPKGFDIQLLTVNDTTDIRAVGVSKFTNDGKTYVHGSSFEGVTIFDFDRCSGILTKHDEVLRDSLLGISQQTGFISTSPNSKYLYAGHISSVFQFDLEAVDISASKEVIYEWSKFPTDTILTAFRMYQQTPDGRIYISRNPGVNDYHLIHKPNEKGRACNLDFNRQFEKPGSFGAPNFPNFRLGRWEQSSCDTLFTTIGHVEFYKGSLDVFPNPANHFTRIDYSGLIWKRVEDMQLNVIDNIGRVVYSRSIPEYSAYQDIELSKLSNGLYFVELSSNDNVIVSTKLVKQ